MSIDHEAIRNAFRKRAIASKTRGLVYSCKEGKNIVRLLPPPPGQLPWYEGGIHWGMERKHCRRMFLEEDCPICTVSEALLRSENEEDKEFGRQLQPSPIFFFPVVFRTMEDKGPLLLRVPGPVFDDIVGHMADEDEPIDLTEPKKGYDVCIHRSGTGLGTRYRVQVSHKVKPLGTPEQIKAWTSNLPDWEEWCAAEIDSFETLARLVALPEEEEFEPAEKEEAPAPKKKKRGRPKKTAAKKKKAAPAPVEEEEEEDEFDDFEELEDEIPFESGGASEAEDAAPFEEAYGDDEDDFEVDEETGKVMPRTRKEVARAAKKGMKKQTLASTDEIAAKMRDRMKQIRGK